MRGARGRWLPGESANPGGRPKGRGLKQEIERTLAEKPKGGRETRLERIAKVLVAKAEEGDLRALELILKRLWPEKLEVQGDSELVVMIRDYTGLRGNVATTVNVKPGEQPVGQIEDRTDPGTGQSGEADQDRVEEHGHGDHALQHGPAEPKKFVAIIDDDQPAEVAYGKIVRPAPPPLEQEREDARWGEDPADGWREA
jgi:hypothetical protein